jgi:hypothetical protein
MTCIAGLVYENKVWIGADSAGVAGLSITPRKDPKVFLNGDFLIGFTSSFRMGALLRYRFTPPRPVEDQDIDQYMNTTFIDTLRSCLKSGGYASKSNETESGGCFLVGYRGRLFCIESDYQVGEGVLSYEAVGCGRDLALGSLFTTQKTKQGPRDRIRIALEAAEQFSAGVVSPFNILST